MVIYPIEAAALICRGAFSRLPETPFTLNLA